MGKQSIQKLSLKDILYKFSSFFQISRIIIAFSQSINTVTGRTGQV